MTETPAGRGEHADGSGSLRTAVSNCAVAFHREHFGRGPGSSKAMITEELVICVLTDIFTPAEKTLIEAGHGSRVRDTRAIHAVATDRDYTDRIESALGRRVEFHVSSVHMDPDLAIDIFLLD